MSRIQAELDCDAVVRGFPGLPAPYVQVFSHVRAEVPDLPDRLYTVRGVDLWWEVKGAGEKIDNRGGGTKPDRLTKGQFEFLERRYKAGGIVGAGDAVQLRAMLYGPVPSQWRAHAWPLVLALKARGFRDE